MSFESCSKKRSLEDDIDQKSKPAIDDFCRKKFKPIAPKPTLKKDQHQAVVLTTLPVKSSYLEDNDSCKMKCIATSESEKQMVLMSPPHMHVMSNLPVMLHTPTLVAMNSCSPMPVLANYSFVIPVGCGHCNCGKSTPQQVTAQVLCTSSPKNSCSQCVDEHCCNKNLEKDRCKSCDSNSGERFISSSSKKSSENAVNCCSKKEKSAQVPILPLNASLPSNLNEILKLRPEKYKYSMLLNNPGTYNQFAEKTSRQTNNIQLNSQFPPATTSCGFSLTTHQTPSPINVVSCSLTGPTKHTQKNSQESNSSTHSRSLVLPTTTPSSQRTLVPSHISVVSSANTCPNSTKELIHQSHQRFINSRAVEPIINSRTTNLVSPMSVEKDNQSEGNRRILNPLDSHNSQRISYTDNSRYISFDRNTTMIPSNNSSSTESSSASVSHSGLSSVVVNTRKNCSKTRKNMNSEQRPLSKDAATRAENRKNTSLSVESVSVSSRTTSQAQTLLLNENANVPVLQQSKKSTTRTIQSSVMDNSNSRLTATCQRSKGSHANLPLQTPERLHHQLQHNSRKACEIRPVAHQMSMLQKNSVAPKTSQCSRMCNVPSQPSINSLNQPSVVPLTENGISRGHIPFHNTAVITSNTLSNVTHTTNLVSERRHVASTVTSSAIVSQSRQTENTVGREVPSANFQARSHNVNTSSEKEKSDSTVPSRRRSEERNEIRTSGPVTKQAISNLPERSSQAGTAQSLHKQNLSCQHSNIGPTERGARAFSNEPQREQNERDSSSIRSRREWHQMIPQIHASDAPRVATSCHRDASANIHQNSDSRTASSWTHFTRHQNHMSRDQPPSEAIQQTSNLPSEIVSRQSVVDSDAVLPSTVQSDSRVIQTVPLISNVPAPSRHPSNSAISRKQRQRCCVSRQDSNILSSETLLTFQHGPVEHNQSLSTSCSSSGAHKTPNRVAAVREQNMVTPLVDERLAHNILEHRHSQGSEHRLSQASVTDHTFPHQSHNPVARPMLYNFPHMLNSQSDAQHRLSIPGGIGRHSLTNHHMNHLQECNLSTSPHSNQHTPLHQSSSRHLLVPPPPFGPMHRSMFMTPSPHPPDVNLMSPRSFSSTHMHDDLLYSPNIPRLPSNPGYPDRLHTSYPVHYLPEDRIDSCCSGSLRTSHSPTTNNFSSPWILSSPSRTPAPSFLPSFPRHNSLNSLPSSQDLYGFGSSVNMSNLATQHHMPGCLSEINAQHHVEPLQIQTDINSQAERDATGSSQLSPIVTPPPASETLSRKPLRNNSSEPSMSLPLRNSASECIASHPVQRNLMENSVNQILTRNSLGENQISRQSRQSIRSTSSETPGQQPPSRRTSSEQCISQTPITTSTSNTQRNTTLHNSSSLLTAATSGNNSGRRTTTVQNSVQQQPNGSLAQQPNQTTSVSDTASQIMTPSPSPQRTNNKYLPIDEICSNPSTSLASLVAPSPTQSLSDQPVKFNGVTLQCSRQILCESGRTVLCCWHCDFHTAEPKKMHRHQRREEKQMRCQLCSFTSNSRCKVDQHFKDNHLDKDDPFTSAVS
ncbi:mucin-12-like [Anneissia japonica]|uniref:mucin-12-like n=1 Tax=Anneissia japonica TaxID=1529436 RepID=UPI00142579FB|nr:mucin-12-like [Anneissia japonica]XP_033114433.1 mucin-12-like [Anneissia japonica]XP_033114434.1 mucin-12-like [Anneissia japonica]